MKTILLLLLIAFIIPFTLTAQQKDSDSYRSAFDKELGINDRAAGIHNASNIGLYFENRGKLYPRRITEGPSGEFPINSTKHYIYRINPMVGIPGNVVQGRYTTDEEWEAVGGYHNNDIARIAFSDNPETWNPQLGWPVKDSEGNPVIISDQDSYCVYSDSNNTRSVIGILVAQTGYAFGVNFAKNIIFYKFQVINVGQNNLSGVYFDLYTDIDVGNVSGGDPEYSDDRLDFDPEKQVVYFFDDGISNEWPDGKTGYFGVAFLKTPEVNGVQRGITDMHYNLYDDDLDIDTVQYGIMSSAQSLYNSSLGPKFFHLGSNTSLHFDDPETIPASGLDILANVSSGPYGLNVGDTLTFITAIVAGETLDEILEAATQAQNTVDANFELPKPPPRPNLYGMAGNFKSILFWDDIAERSKDKFTGEYDFEGYRIYRSQDQGASWDKLADFDLVNNQGNNTGLQYSFTDTTVVNGIEYWYSITSYDRGDANLESLESPIGNTLESINTISVIPRSDAIGRTPVSSYDILRIAGESNFVLDVNPVDTSNLAGNSYTAGFMYTFKKEKGDLETSVSLEITDSSLTKPYKYGIQFTSASTYNVLNLTTGEIIGREGYNYPPGGRSIDIPGYGIKAILSDAPGTPPEKLPESGDLIAISYSVYVIRNGQDTVTAPRPFSIDQEQSTGDGILYKLIQPDFIQNVSRVDGTDNFDIQFSVAADTLIKTDLYLVSTTGNGMNGEEGFISLIVKNSIMDTVLVADMLYNLDTFEFDGVEGKVVFNSTNPPGAGNIFSVETLAPILPGIKDMYSFKIRGALNDSRLVSQKINNIKVVPNPYMVSSLYEREYGELRREPLRQIQFINLPSECTIYIFSVSADLVKTLHHSSSNGTETWDLRTESGREIAPGVYIYVVKTAGSEFKDRFAVIK
jgi:hypothetical protein